MKVTVGELCNVLSRYDSKLPVCVDGYEGGVTEHVGVRSIEVATNVNADWWNGEHDPEPLGSGAADSEGDGTKIVVLIERLGREQA